MNYNFPRSSLTPSAHEFIPGNSNISFNQPNMNNPEFEQLSSMSGMNLSASSWVPSNGNNNSNRGSNFGSMDQFSSGNININRIMHNQNQSFANTTQMESSISRGDGSISIPSYAPNEMLMKPKVSTDVNNIRGVYSNTQDRSSETFSTNQYDDSNNHSNSITPMPTDYVDGDYLTLNLPSTLPTPIKRTMQTIGLPEPIRQHFQSLDIQALKQMSPDDNRYKEIPMRFHSAYPLDSSAATVRGWKNIFI